MVEHLVLPTSLLTCFFPTPNTVLLTLENLLLEHVKFLTRSFRMFFLLLLLHLLQHFLVCLQLKIRDHLVLHPRLIFILLLPLDRIDFFIHGTMLIFSQLFLLCHRSLYRSFNCLDVLKSSFTLKLI